MASTAPVALEAMSPYEQQLFHLQRQLDIECKVKQGADNMIAEYSQSQTKENKKLLSEAQQMSADSKARIEYLRMKIKKIQANKEENEGSLPASDGGDSLAPASLPAGGSGGARRGRAAEDSLENRVEELRHRLRIESACLEGARNAIKLLQGVKQD